MADPQANATESQSRPGRPDGGSPQAPAESRAFEATADAARRAVDGGADTARDLARSGVEAAREAAQNVAEAGRETHRQKSEAGRRGVDLWRESVTPFVVLSTEMNRWVDQIWRQALVGAVAPGVPSFGAPGSAMLQGLMGLPSADLRETPDAYHFTVELAGMSPDAVEVTLDGDSLVISGERRDLQQDQKAGYRVAERRFGRFERRFSLPRDADRPRVTAEFDNGLLRITAPRRPEDGPGRRRIEVKPAPPLAH
jgi:HSP20 family protein